VLLNFLKCNVSLAQAYPRTSLEPCKYIQTFTNNHATPFHKTVQIIFALIGLETGIICSFKLQQYLLFYFHGGHPKTLGVQGRGSGKSFTDSLFVIKYNYLLVVLHTGNSRFFEPQRETKISMKNQVFHEIRDTVFHHGEKNDFWFKLLGDSKIKGLRN